MTTSEKLNKYFIPTGMKFGYGVGDLAFNILINATSLYLLYFFTDVFIIGAASAGIIFLVSKLWNAAIDPFIGFMIDRTNTRWGKKRPYMLFGAIPLAICFYLIFANPQLSASMRFVYGMATFLLFNSVFAIVNVPYAALTASMTLDTNERSVLTGFRMSFAIVGTLVAAGATKPLVGLFADEATGFKFVGILFGIIAAIIIIISFATVKERVQPADEAEEHSFGSNMKAMLKNPPFILLVLSFFVTAVAIYATASTVNYFFKYNLQREELIPYAFLALFATAILAIPVWVYVSKKTSKKTSFITGLLIFSVSLLVIYLYPDLPPVMLIFLLCFAGIGMATYFLFPWAMVPDTVEYSEWKTGIRQEGFLYGFFVFGLKLSQAFAGFLAGFALDSFGYIPNTIQSATTLSGIRSLMTIIPCGLILFGILFLVFYPINAQMHAKMLGEIDTSQKNSLK